MRRAEYIEKGHLLACLYSRQDDENLDVMAEIASFPTADVAPVVRCKDCKYFLPPTKSVFTACSYDKCGGMLAPKLNDFCSYGEKKDGGSDE